MEGRTIVVICDSSDNANEDNHVKDTISGVKVGGGGGGILMCALGLEDDEADDKRRLPIRGLGANSANTESSSEVAARTLREAAMSTNGSVSIEKPKASSSA